MTTKTKVQCPNKDCKKYFGNQAKLDSHLKLVHRTEPVEAEPEDRPFKCGQCEYAARTSQGLNMHMTKAHKEEETEPQPKKVTNGVSYADLESLTQKLTQENIRLGNELEQVHDELYRANEELDKIKAEEKPGGILVTKRDVQQLRRLQLMVSGDPEGKTDAERLGLQKVYEMTCEANKRLQEDLALAHRGLLPKEWIDQIKGDLQTSVDMIVTGMQDNVRERAKVVKYDALVKLLQEETNE